jgi:ADP-ribose pyrophosphatase
MPTPADNPLSPWKTLGRELLLSAPPWLTVFSERVELPSGRVVNDFYNIVLPQFALIVPWTEDGKLVLVRGYKHGVGRINLSPPAGLIEPGEEPLATARRELLEETGYEADDWQSLGDYVVDGNRGCGRMHLFAASSARLVRPPRDDDGEVLRTEVLSPAEAVDALRRGKIGNLAGAGGLALALVLSCPP